MVHDDIIIPDEFESIFMRLHRVDSIEMPEQEV